ncbi:ABC transporter ATP-binding protein [Hyphomonas jannaschiana]|uniref:Iron ABC transporter ATP-binding protein n=1 Tax=Hyphomonas jannaschiana VP2 TaxID=1280952 RepID=A0A059F7M1_9PROT|nr:ABC transporter ATP-binding protein [Hyphomonas jannaschiana]KCZ86585.1 iron ABC transporter ATP-binding protein [Hyphomonas jannaschiana VP2]
MSESLSAIGVSRAYHGVRVVDSVSLDLKPGAITALLGGSGAGKSTLLRLFAGLEPVDDGEIRLGGRVLSSTKTTLAPDKRRIGLIFQDFALFPHLTALQNVQFGLKPLGKEAAQAEALAWLGRLGLTQRADAYPHELSGGEQQRVAIARALAPKPAAILMDEPFSGLDPALRASVRDEALEAVRAADIPALLVTHDPMEALEAADHVAIMRGGRIRQEGPAAEVYMNPVSADVAASLGPVNRMAAAGVPAGLAEMAEGMELVVRPEGICLDPESKVRAKVLASQVTGAMTRLVLEAGGQRLVALVPRHQAPKAGEETGIRLDPALSFIFPSA